jgi:hypothetical protein
MHGDAVVQELPVCAGCFLICFSITPLLPFDCYCMPTLPRMLTTLPLTNPQGVASGDPFAK